VGEELGLSPVDVASFRSLLGRSLLPVDAGYLEDNLRAFAALVGKGVPADAILEAYDGYAAYQSRMEARCGESRPMHLLRWLRQSPNKNITYVLNSRDEEWRRQHPGVTWRRTDSGGRGRDGPRPSHEAPELTRCRDNGRVLWFVIDERGGRIVRGSKDVESLEHARDLYERMYEDEGRQAL
jgi:hypothetical protein